MKKGSSLCRFCGRNECKCGEPYPSKLCSKHGRTMMVVSIASRRPTKLEGIFEWKWFQAVVCSKCPFMRPLKQGQGVPRNENRKTSRSKSRPSRKSDLPGGEVVIERFKRKFKAEVRAVVDYSVTEQETRGLQVRANALLRASRESDKRSSEATRSFQTKVDNFWEEQKRLARIAADQDVPF